MVKSILTASLLFLLSNQAILNVAANQHMAPRRDGDDDETPLVMSNNNGTMAINLAENSARDLFSLDPRQNWVCDPGYSNCPHDASKCCQTGKKCCGTGYCAKVGDTCCADKGSCPSGWGCCGADNCYPKGGECCNDGTYCNAGRECRVYKGARKCCRPSGCVGENDEDEDNDDGDDTDDNIASETNTRTTSPTPTPTPTGDIDDIIDDILEWEYYTTVIVWYFYVWFYTAAPPYTVTTVTSTRESTSTTWSVYASDSASAMSELADRSSTYSFPTPVMATMFKPDSTGGSGPPATASATPDDGDGGSDNLNAPGPNEAAASSITSPSGSSFWWITICLGSLLPFLLFTVLA